MGRDDIESDTQSWDSAHYSDSIASPDGVESDAQSRDSAHSMSPDGSESDIEEVSPLHHIAHLPLQVDENDDEDDDYYGISTTRTSSALLEHVAALHLKEYVEARTGRKIALRSRRHRSQGAFETMLKERGFSITADRRADDFDDVDANSLVIMLKPRLKLCWNLARRSDRPAMLITTFVRDTAKPAEEGQVVPIMERIIGAVLLWIQRWYGEYQAIPWASECCALPEHCNDTVHSAWIYQHNKHAVIDDGETPGRGSSHEPRRYQHRIRQPSPPIKNRCGPCFNCV